MLKTSTRGWRRRVSTAATAVLVVPRSIPIRNRLSGISRGSRLADVQLQLPAVGTLFLVAPELEGSDLRDPALERNGHHIVGGPTAQRGISFERHLERAQLLEVVAPVL